MNWWLQAPRQHQLPNELATNKEVKMKIPFEALVLPHSEQQHLYVTLNKIPSIFFAKALVIDNLTG